MSRSADSQDRVGVAEIAAGPSSTDGSVLASDPHRERRAIASPISLVRGSREGPRAYCRDDECGAPAGVIVERERLVGRKRERAALDRLLETARGGHAGVLVVHGEPGVGKTALLEYALEAGQGYRVARTSGVEAEMELPFAALQRLCSPFIEHEERLPQPQRDALGVAFGLTAGPSPNPFLVGLAVLGLLAEARRTGRC